MADDNTYNNRSIIFKFNRTDQLMNSSFCHISSLEVYRGREQAIDISHEGFSLSENGSIKVKVILNFATYVHMLLSRSIQIH